MTSRYERGESPYKWITKRDKAIVEAIYTARYLTRSQIQTLFFGSETRAKTRLRVLFNKGFIQKRKVFSTQEDIFFLDRRGRRYIQIKYEMDAQMVRKIAGNEGTGLPEDNSQVEHDLQISGLYVDAALTCRNQEWGLEWQNARMLELLKLGFQPDAYLKVTGDKGYREAFIEYTDAISSIAVLRKKVEAYENYWRSTRPVPLLWVGKGRSTMSALQRVIAKSRYPDYILLADYDACSSFLVSSLWQSWGPDGKRGAVVQFLVPRTTEVVLFKS